MGGRESARLLKALAALVKGHSAVLSTQARYSDSLGDSCPLLISVGTHAPTAYIHTDKHINIHRIKSLKKKSTYFLVRSLFTDGLCSHPVKRSHPLSTHIVPPLLSSGYVCARACTHIYVCTHIYIYICMHAYMHNTYINIYLCTG